MKFRFAVIVLILITAGLSRMQAQDANSFYFMKGVPQIYQINPAFQPECNFFLGLPGLAPTMVKTSNSFTLGDLLEYNDEIDSLIFFLHPLGKGEEAFLNALDDQNHFITEISTSLASFGFRYEELYFTFDIRERASFRMDYSKDYLRFPVVGPDNDQFFDMDLGIDISLMNEFSMGVSHKLTDGLTVGLRGKLLFGQANARTERFDLTVATSEDVWNVHNDISINTSAPYLIDYINFAVAAPLELITGDLEDFDLDTPSAGEITRLVVNPRNFGLALDLGVDYRLYDWLQLSASIVDFGSVKWKDNMINLQHKADYDFEGVEISLSDDEFTDSFLDSLEATYDKFTASPVEYRTYLPTKIFLGGAFYPHPKISFGLLSRTEIFRGDVNQQFTVSANFNPIRFFSATLSYSVLNNTYQNLGFGLALNAVPFNLYILTDTGPTVYFFPEKAKYMNLKIGMNIVIGCKKEKKFDLPLID